MNDHALDFSDVDPLPCPFCGIVPVVLDYGWMHGDNECILRNTVVSGVGDWNQRISVSESICNPAFSFWSDAREDIYNTDA